jgi:hypothetical protein
MLKQAASYRELAARARQLANMVRTEQDKAHLLLQAAQLEEMAAILERAETPDRSE